MQHMNTEHKNLQHTNISYIVFTDLGASHVCFSMDQKPLVLYEYSMKNNVLLWSTADNTVIFAVSTTKTTPL
jgi:hypothetical protein